MRLKLGPVSQTWGHQIVFEQGVKLGLSSISNFASLFESWDTIFFNHKILDTIILCESWKFQRCAPKILRAPEVTISCEYSFLGTIWKLHIKMYVFDSKVIFQCDGYHDGTQNCIIEKYGTGTLTFKTVYWIECYLQKQKDFFCVCSF